MAPSGPNLGMCFAARQVFYAVNDQAAPGRLGHIGCFNFNFNIAPAIRTQDPQDFEGIHNLIGRLKKEYDFSQIRMLTIPDHECWTILPKLVYDQADEREAHLKVIMKGLNRQVLEPVWYELSGLDYKLLAIRNKHTMAGYERLTEHTSSADFCSDFEIGLRWVNHKKDKGSFLTISCYPGLLSVSSYMLGKLRGATYMHFDDFDDLPYLWKHYATHLKWFDGVHDQILLYGLDTYKVIDVLEPHWDRGATIMKMDTLDTMGVSADETTYSFNLEAAFPAVMLALDH